MKTYNVEAINNIPILKIAERLGLEVDKNKKAKCFIHSEKTSSLSFNASKNYWKCFGCENGGTVINLVEEFYSIEFIEACEWLSSEFNITVVDFNGKKFFPVKRSFVRKEKSKNTNTLLNQTKDSELYKWVIENCGLSSEGENYLLNDRQIPEELVKSFFLGDIKEPNVFFQKAKDKWGFERLLKSGLAKLTDKGEEKFIWWDHVILIPFFNEQNNIVYIQGRRLNGEKPKYINLKGQKTEIFNSKILATLCQKDKVCICEGAMDAISAVKNNINAIGIIGASGFKKEWVSRLADFMVFVIPDNDVAGQNFAQSISLNFDEIGKSVQIIKLPQKVKDVSEYFHLIKQQ